jgi:hypothetical protein
MSPLSNTMSASFPALMDPLFFPEIPHVCLRSAPNVRIGVRAYSHDVVAKNSNGLRRENRLIHGPHFRVADNQISGWLTLRLAIVERRQAQTCQYSAQSLQSIYHHEVSPV